MFMEAVRCKKEFTEFEWESYSKTGHTRLHKGAWILCDQGYHLWGMMICAFASSTAGTEMGPFNSRIGSVRKDIEDTFGILKKRFRVLRFPMLYSPTTRIGTIFRVCAILHNRLLDYDNLDDIGQEEEHWIEADARATREALVESNRHCPAAEDKDYSYLSEPFIPLGLPGLEEERRHHGLKDALLEHFTFVKTTGQLRWLKTASQIVAETIENTVTN